MSRGVSRSCWHEIEWIFMILGMFVFECEEGKLNGGECQSLAIHKASGAHSYILHSHNNLEKYKASISH